MGKHSRRMPKTLVDHIMIDDFALIYYVYPFLKSQHRIVLQKTYGSDLKGQYDSSLLTEHERKNVLHSAIRSLKNKINETEIISVTIDPKRISNASPYFYERFGVYDARDVLRVFQSFDEDMKRIFYKVYGSNLLDTYRDDFLTKEEKEDFETGMKHLQQSLAYYTKMSFSMPVSYILGYQYAPKKRGTKPKNLIELNSQYSFQEIKDAVSKLSSEDQLYLKMAYGENFDTVSGRNFMSEKEKSHLTWIIRGSLKYYLEHPDIFDNDDNQTDSQEVLPNIFEIYSSYSKNEIMDAISCLSKNNQEFLKKVYGDDFSNIQLPSLYFQRVCPVLKKVFQYPEEEGKH